MYARFRLIDSLENDDLRVYVISSEVQLLRLNEPEPGVFVAESALVINRALEAGYEPLSVLVEVDDGNNINSEARTLVDSMVGSWDVPIYGARHDCISEITGYNLTRGVLCAMRRKNNSDCMDALQKAKNVVVLDHVVNPTNMGAIFRSAAAFGVDMVLVTKDCTDPLYRRSIRVSMGNVFNVPWFYISNEYIDVLKKTGYKTIAMALREDSLKLGDTHIQVVDKKAIIMGNEGYGLDDSIIAQMDYTVMIPMYNGVDSLNVAAASAVAFWELLK